MSSLCSRKKSPGWETYRLVIFDERCETPSSFEFEAVRGLDALR